ncbi:hypothetical protein BGZ47_001207 [Haplosporangium gracile]|nr:hypothetical protein BGZ47_001207 [Haplosporangium gracile]
MHFFKKSSNNQTTSAAPTPPQTPRTSLHEQRPSTMAGDHKQHQLQQNEQGRKVEQSLHELIATTMHGGRNGFVV